MTDDQKQVLKDIAEKYDLTKDHFFVTKHFIVVNKIGIEKIAEIENIDMVIDVIDCSKDYAAVKCCGRRKGSSDLYVFTYASAHGGNSQNNYYLEMSIKRAKAKCVLTIIGAYSKGIYSEAEADEFEQDGKR